MLGCQCCIIRGTTSDKGDEISKLDSFDSFKVGIELESALLSELIAVEWFVAFRRFGGNIFFLLLCDCLQPSFLYHLFFQELDFLYLQLENFPVLCDKEVVGFFFKGDGFWCYKYFSFIDTDQNGRTICWSPHFVGPAFVHDNDSPLRLFGCFLYDILHFPYCFNHFHPVFLKFIQKLSYHFRICFAVKFSIF